MNAFGSAHEVEAAFYRAFEQGSQELMTDVWWDSPAVVCVHPGGERLQGAAAVLASWRGILEAMRGVVVRITDVVEIVEGNLAVHHLREQMFIGGERRGVMLATNVYRNTEGGWRMLLHHAAPDPEPPPLPASAGLH